VQQTLLRTGEVPALLGVSPQTVARWDLRCLYTLGGQRRYRCGDVRARLERDVCLLDGQTAFCQGEKPC
jgi:DNA-binding transcriptional MerR regulator